jgi:hypothetical protein
MTEPIKLPPLTVKMLMDVFGSHADIPPALLCTSWKDGIDIDETSMRAQMLVEAYARLAVEQNTAELRAELAAAEYALRSKGYRKSCEISACNCGDQWSHGGNAEARLRELSSELHGSPVDMNGKTLLAGLSELVERADKAEAEVERLRAELARLTKPPSPPPLWGKGCPVCGMFSQPGVYGVVCARGDCPTRVTCGVTK